MHRLRLATLVSLVAVLAFTAQGQAPSVDNGVAMDQMERYLVSRYPKTTKLFLIYHPACFVNDEVECSPILPQTEDSSAVKRIVDSLVEGLTQRGYQVSRDSLAFSTWIREQKKAEGLFAVMALSPVRIQDKEWKAIQLTELRNKESCLDCTYASTNEFSWRVSAPRSITQRAILTDRLSVVLPPRP